MAKRQQPARQQIYPRKAGDPACPCRRNDQSVWTYPRGNQGQLIRGRVFCGECGRFIGYFEPGK